MVERSTQSSVVRSRVGDSGHGNLYAYFGRTSDGCATCSAKLCQVYWPHCLEHASRSKLSSRRVSAREFQRVRRTFAYCNVRDEHSKCHVCLQTQGRKRNVGNPILAFAICAVCRLQEPREWRTLGRSGQCRLYGM